MNILKENCKSQNLEFLLEEEMFKVATWSHRAQRKDTVVGQRLCEGWEAGTEICTQMSVCAVENLEEIEHSWSEVVRQKVRDESKSLSEPD
jgi:hypothetical protein